MSTTNVRITDGDGTLKIEPLRRGRQPTFPGGLWHEETFDQRRERAVGLPAEYAKEWARHVSELMTSDNTSAYFAYALWTKAAWGRDFKQTTRRIQRACQYAACDAFPTLNPTSLNRIPLHLAVGALVLPAEKRDGVRHVHGFVRLPSEACRIGQSRVRVETHGEAAWITMPRVLGRFTQYLRRFAEGRVTSLHIGHANGEAIDCGADQRERWRQLLYLNARGKEVRSWDCLEMVPLSLWRRLTRDARPSDDGLRFVNDAIVCTG